MSTETWAMGNAFSIADGAAAPALFYADLAAALRRHVSARIVSNLLVKV